MSKVVCCDRCGKNLDRGLNLLKCVNVKFIKEVVIWSEDIDLCNDCRKKFNRFMDGAELKEGDNE